MPCQGIRGAITASANTRESIIAATKELLTEITIANDVTANDIAAVFFTTTPDLNAEFPAAATREMGWPHYLALIDGHEMDVPHSLHRCIRILMLVNTEKTPEQIKHIYLKEAKSLISRSTR